VHPVSSRGYLFKGVGKITYHGCSEEFSDQGIYNLTQQGAADDDASRWKADELYAARDGRLAPYKWWNGIHMCSYTGYPVVQLGVPPVCKQLYFEATPLMWKTTTLCFTSSPDFQDFVKTSPAMVARVQQLTLCPRDERNGWDAVLTPQAVGSFTSLQGLHLVLELVLTNPHKHKFNILKSPPSHIRHVTNLVTQFQGLPLQREQTTVWVTGSYDGVLYTHSLNIPLTQITVGQRLEIAEHIRESLLNYKPRRRTGRGRG
jgi:hypothetical protein